MGLAWEEENYGCDGQFLIFWLVEWKRRVLFSTSKYKQFIWPMARQIAEKCFELCISFFLFTYPHTAKVLQASRDVCNFCQVGEGAVVCLWNLDKCKLFTPRFTIICLAEFPPV